MPAQVDEAGQPPPATRVVAVARACAVTGRRRCPSVIAVENGDSGALEDHNKRPPSLHWSTQRKRDFPVKQFRDGYHTPL